VTRILQPFVAEKKSFQATCPGPYNKVKWQAWCPYGQECVQGGKNFTEKFASREEAIDRVVRHMRDSQKHKEANGLKDNLTFIDSAIAIMTQDSMFSYWLFCYVLFVYGPLHFG